MDRLLLNYYPGFLRQYQEYQAVSHAEQPEAEQLWEALAQSLRDQFAADSGEYGISRWEGIMRIIPKGTETLEHRRFRILTRLSEQLPYTIRMLEQQMKALCGQGRYRIWMECEKYLLVVRVSLMARDNLEEVADLLTRIVPANMIIDLSLEYNEHQLLNGYTHKQLSNNTHNRLRNEVVISG